MQLKLSRITERLADPRSWTVDRQAGFPASSLSRAFSTRTLVNGALVAGAIGAALWLLFGTQVEPTAPPSPPDEDVASRASTFVQLPAQKLAKAAITTQPASLQTLSHTHTVPGRIEYNGARRLQLRLPVECVVKEVFVRPGQEVQEGAKLAVLSSQQVGLARDAVQQCEEDLKLSRHQLQWHDDIRKNVGDLLADLAQLPQMPDLESAYQDRPLGAHRRTLLAAYSDFRLAQQIQQDSEVIGEQGVLSGRTVKERRNALERARATFHSVCEETKHEVSIEQQTAETAVARAERALKISAEQFATLLGPYGTKLVDSAEALSDFVLTAPFAGRIEERHIMPAAVIAANDPLFTLANTDQLWVSAQIHERNWQAASTTAGKTVRLRTPATGDQVFTATIEFVGAVVDQKTHALPLIASIENPEHLFKPGMFVWVTVPVEAARDALAVRASAVMRHEGQAFVFVTDAPDRFRRVDVTTGLETDEWIEIRSGLVAGDLVAASGVFALKSELLLERDEG